MKMYNQRRDARFVRPNDNALYINAYPGGFTNRASLQSLPVVPPVRMAHPDGREACGHDPLFRPTTASFRGAGGIEGMVGRSKGVGWRAYRYRSSLRLLPNW